jgi:hypothetical protein
MEITNKRENWKLYTEPLSINETTEIQAKLTTTEIQATLYHLTYKKPLHGKSL